ncbi:MAG TPA: hypothetical protein VN345_08855, partial [Blastocatellia bacterium]|nr:hypothetical protein [Blastocatellia bacterium]
MKMLRVRSGAVKSARYRLILLMISGAVLLQVPSWLGRAKLGSGTSSAFQMGEDHYLRIPYFTESDGMDSTLTLNNNMPQVMAAMVTLFSKEREALALPPIFLRPTSPIRLSLGELSKGGRGDFSSGNVQVFFHGPSMGVTSQMSISSAAKRLAFESVESEAMDFSSSKLDGIVWLPDEETRGSLALTNTTAGDLSIVGKTAQLEGSEAKIFTLGAHETRLVDVVESFGIKGAGVSALVSLEHTGSPGALIVTGFATNAGTGFSTNLVFWDRSTLRTTHLAGAHVRFGRANAGEGFSPGTTFHAPLVIANAGSEATSASLFMDCTAGSQTRRVALGQISLAPMGLKQIDLSTEMARRGVTGPVDDAGIDIDYSGPPGSVVARLVCFDQSGDLSFDAPVKDPLAGVMGSDSGSYPWRLDGGFTTVVHLKNYTSKPVYGIVQVRYEGGTYNPERISLAPYQTIALDIKELRDAQKPDIRGGVMPKDIEGGQV